MDNEEFLNVDFTKKNPLSKKVLANNSEIVLNALETFTPEAFIKELSALGFNFAQYVEKYRTVIEQCGMVLFECETEKDNFYVFDDKFLNMFGCIPKNYGEFYNMLTERSPEKKEEIENVLSIKGIFKASDLGKKWITVTGRFNNIYGKDNVFLTVSLSPFIDKNNLVRIIGYVRDENKNAQELEREIKLSGFTKSIEAVYEAAFEIDTEENSVYDIFIKKGTVLHKEFFNRKMSYSRLCRIIITEIADSADVEALTEFFGPARIKEVSCDKTQNNEERIQFRVRNTDPVLWKECRVVYYRDEKPIKLICTLKDITYEKNYELKYTAQSELLYATRKSEREIREKFIYAVKNTYDIIAEYNYTSLECFEYDFSSNNINKKRAADLKENFNYLAKEVIYIDDVNKFLNLYSVSNILKLAESGIKNVDVKLRLKINNKSESEYEWYFLMGIISRNENNEIILTVFCKNINNDETERIKDMNSLESSLRMSRDSLLKEGQFKKALESCAYFSFSANIDKDLIKNEFFDANENGLLKAVGLTAPCSLSMFAKRWIDRYVIKCESSDIDLAGFDLEALRDNYRNGRRFYKTSCQVISTAGKIIWLECYTLLVKTEYENDLAMLHYAIDITNEKRKNKI